MKTLQPLYKLHQNIAELAITTPTVVMEFSNIYEAERLLYHIMAEVAYYGLEDINPTIKTLHSKKEVQCLYMGITFIVRVIDRRKSDRRNAPKEA